MQALKEGIALVTASVATSSGAPMLSQCARVCRLLCSVVLAEASTLQGSRGRGFSQQAVQPSPAINASKTAPMGPSALRLQPSSHSRPGQQPSQHCNNAPVRNQHLGCSRRDSSTDSEKRQGLATYSSHCQAIGLLLTVDTLFPARLSSASLVHYIAVCASAHISP